MGWQISSLFLILACSAGLNAVLALKLKKSKKAPVPSIEMKEFLADLARDKFGMVAVARVNTDDILLRSTRGR